MERQLVEWLQAVGREERVLEGNLLVMGPRSTDMGAFLFRGHNRGINPNNNGSLVARASWLSACPACRQEDNRTQTAPGYAGASMHTASKAENCDAPGLASGGDALGVTVTELVRLCFVLCNVGKPQAAARTSFPSMRPTCWAPLSALVPLLHRNIA